MQVLYAYMINRPEQTRQMAKKELQTSLEKSYELYNYLLKLPIELTDLQERRLDEARYKYLPSPEDENPNMKFVNNQLVEGLRNSTILQDYCKEHLITWSDNPIFLHLMLNKVTTSDIYAQYMAEQESTMESDSKLWQQLLKQVILPDDNLTEEVEQRSVYWCIDDLDIMGQFAIKTFKRVAEGDCSAISPMYKDEEDALFGEQLFVTTVNQMDENNALIDDVLQQGRWDAKRIVLMDRLIMCAAISELRTFEKIPTAVTLNEYIELAKNFSTPNSGQFINGVLNSVVKTLRKQGQIVKP